VRGDMEMNETKLAGVLAARELRPATETEIRAAGAVPGYASPAGLRDAIVVVDDAVAASPNLVAGANEEGFHLLNTNCGRDYEPTAIADIAAAAEGNSCPGCGAPLRAVRGVEVGNIFKLGTRYSTAAGCSFLDRDGVEKPVVMGSYGIGVGRLLACIAEEHHDEHGLAWPITVAPYDVHVVLVPGGAAREAADKLYAELEAAGVETLYDDREERAGVKFNDADLIGVPLRLTVGDRGLARGGVELKHRRAKEPVLVPAAEAIGRVKAEIAALRAALGASDARPSVPPLRAATLPSP
jgi:prolyl-tRNA synthetase